MLFELEYCHHQLGVTNTTNCNSQISISERRECQRWVNIRWLSIVVRLVHDTVVSYELPAWPSTADFSSLAINETAVWQPWQEVLKPSLESYWSLYVYQSIAIVVLLYSADITGAWNKCWFSSFMHNHHLFPAPVADITGC